VRQLKELKQRVKKIVLICSWCGREATWNLKLKFAMLHGFLRCKNSAMEERRKQCTGRERDRDRDS
jgi:hypothetical protein